MSTSLFRKKNIATILRDAESGMHDGEHVSLKKVLGVRDLTFFGVAAIIGAGIFSSIGKACYDGGPGVIYLYIFTAVACGFAALCYAEFASTVPVSGSAYTYSYVAFGEIFAWIIGWDLLMEYAIGNIAVAISWSDYFTNLMDKAGLHISNWLTMDYVTAHSGFTEVTNQLAGGSAMQSIDPALLSQYDVPSESDSECVVWLAFVGVSFWLILGREDSSDESEDGRPRKPQKARNPKIGIWLAAWG